MIAATFFGHTDIVNYLVSQGANLDLKVTSGKRAIDYAIERNYSEIKNILEIATESKSLLLLNSLKKLQILF